MVDESSIRELFGNETLDVVGGKSGGELRKILVDNGIEVPTDMTDEQVKTTVVEGFKMAKDNPTETAKILSEVQTENVTGGGMSKRMKKGLAITGQLVGAVGIAVVSFGIGWKGKGWYDKKHQKKEEANPAFNASLLNSSAGTVPSGLGEKEKESTSLTATTD